MNIKSNKHCCKYIKNRPSLNRLDGNIVVKAFEDAGLIPLFKAEDYKSNMQSLPYTCNKHPDKGVQYRTYGSIKSGSNKGCLECSREATWDNLRLDFNFVKERFIEKNLIICDGEVYKSKEDYLRCYCLKHPEQVLERTYGSIRNTETPCPICRNDKSITEINRLLRSVTKNWKTRIEEECEYKCVLTNSKNYEVHHLYPFSKIIKDVINELNINIEDYTPNDIIRIREEVTRIHDTLSGVCLRTDLHILFHKIYSKDNCSESDFEKFKNKYINGKLEDVI